MCFLLQYTHHFKLNATSNRLNTKATGRFLFNEIFGLFNSITGGTPISISGSTGDDDDDDGNDDTRRKNCTCGKKCNLICSYLEIFNNNSNKLYLQEKRR